MAQNPVAVDIKHNKTETKQFNAKFDRCLVKHIIYFVLYVCKREYKI